MSKFNLDEAVNNVAKYFNIEVEEVKLGYERYNFKKHLDIDALKHYMTWCDGEQFKKDIFDEARFTNEYVRGKFAEFQDRFPYFLHSLSDTYKTRFCVAVHEFYQNNHKKLKGEIR